MLLHHDHDQGLRPTARRLFPSPGECRNELELPKLRICRPTRKGEPEILLLSCFGNPRFPSAAESG